MDTIISTEKPQASEGSNPIHLYRSSRHLGVAPSAPPSQYVGAPIQYCPTKWVEQPGQHLPAQEVLLQPPGTEVIYPPVAAAEVVTEVASHEVYQQMGNQDVYQHPVVYQEVQRPEVYQPTSQKTYTVQAGVTYQVPTVGVERNGLTEYVPDPKQVPGLNYFPTHTVEQNGFTGYAASPSVGQEYASSYTTSTSDYTSEYILSSPECVPATPEFPPQPPVISAEVASVPPAQYVQYVPYYFYYPVGVPASTLNNSSSVPGAPAPRVRGQPVCVQSQTSSSSSASSDSYILRTERKGGGRRRRRKRGESEKVPMVRRQFVSNLETFETFLQEAALGDVDSGYVNGEESSSEPGSEREGVDGHSEIIDSGLEVIAWEAPKQH